MSMPPKIRSSIELNAYALISDRLEDVLCAPALARPFKYREDRPTDEQLKVLAERAHQLVMGELGVIIKWE
jgi:hypothetical protein